MCCRRIATTIIAFSLATFLPAATTLPLPSHGDTVRLIITGDAGASHSRLREGILAVQKSKPLDGIMLVGDNFYPCGVRSVEDPQWAKITDHFGPAQVPIFAILGNHDFGNPDPDGKLPALCAAAASNPSAQVEATGRIPEWHLPARSYRLRGVFADFFMADTEPVAMNWSEPRFGSEASAAVKKRLQQALHESAAHWKIVVGHHTIYSSGVHGRVNGFDQSHMRLMLPMLEQERVDLYVCGHDHDMELIGDLSAHGAPLFLISGAGSGLDEMKVRKAQGEPPTVFPPLPPKPFYGFALLELTKTTMSVSFYDEHGTLEGGPFVMRKP
jgi:tartrate-resistant acid phosphatase type 5